MQLDKCLHTMYKLIYQLKNYNCPHFFLSFCLSLEFNQYLQVWSEINDPIYLSNNFDGFNSRNVYAVSLSNADKFCGNPILTQGCFHNKKRVF